MKRLLTTAIMVLTMVGSASATESHPNRPPIGCQVTISGTEPHLTVVASGRLSFYTRDGVSEYVELNGRRGNAGSGPIQIWGTDEPLQIAVHRCR